MDMTFPRRGEHVEGRSGPIARARLAEWLRASGADGAGRPVEPDPPAPWAGADDPLTELLVGGPEWKKAAQAQQGCFSRAEAGRRVNGS